jgi:hypothetical protein
MVFSPMGVVQLCNITFFEINAMYIAVEGHEAESYTGLDQHF